MIYLILGISFSSKDYRKIPTRCGRKNMLVIHFYASSLQKLTLLMVLYIKLIGEQIYFVLVLW